MKDKIEVGMYVRYKSYSYTSIFKVVKIQRDKIYSFYKDETNLSYGLREDVIKASYDILDLIKKDDIVAYYNKLQDVKGLVIERVQDNNYVKRLKEFVQAGTINIVRVMTKEQFEQHSYKIDEVSHE